MRLPLALLASCLAAASHAVAQDNAELLARVHAVLKDTPLVDGHNDTPWQYYKRVKNHLRQMDLAADLSALDPPMHTDISRLRAGGMGAQFWSVYVPASYDGARGVQAVIEQIDLARRIVDKHPETFELALTADDIVRIHREGRIASLMGMEGGHSIGASLAVLRMTYELGARYMTLTHSDNIDWADSATDEPAVGGLTTFGAEVVREMNRLGMLVDLSHVHDLTMHDALDVSDAPVIFSHSSARGVTNHPRNVPDDILQRLPEKDGIVMVTFLSNYVDTLFMEYVERLMPERDRLTELYPNDDAAVQAGILAWRQANPPPTNATIADVADHVDHIRDTIGIDYIGIGGDYDGTTFLPEGLHDVSTYPALFVELLRRGYSDNDIRKIAGQNFLRVFRKAEAVAARLQKERHASDARIEELDAPGS